MINSCSPSVTVTAEIQDWDDATDVIYWILKMYDPFGSEHYDVELTFTPQIVGCSRNRLSYCFLDKQKAAVHCFNEVCGSVKFVLSVEYKVFSDESEGYTVTLKDIVVEDKTVASVLTYNVAGLNREEFELKQLLFDGVRCEIFGW